MIGKRFVTLKILLISAAVTLAVNSGNVYAEELLKGLIIQDDVQSKYTAQNDGTVTGTFNMNAVINVKDVYGEWVLIEKENISGWVKNHNLFIKTDTEKLVSFGHITATILNVREKPDLNASMTGKLAMGDDVFILDISEDWFYVKNDKVEGWVFSPYVNVRLQDKKGKMVYKKEAEEVSRGGSSSRDLVNTPDAPSLEKEQEIEILDYKDGEFYIKDEKSTLKWVTAGGIVISDPIMENERIIQIAEKYLGKPYKWGATGPYSFDCSGFTKYVFNQIGIQIPRVSRDQAKAGRAVNRSDLQAGDLVFFDTTGSMNNVITHVGIYMGNNQFIHASSSRSGKYVRISSMEKSFYNTRFVTARRYR